MAKKSVKLYTDNVLEEFYKHVLDGNLDKLHIPHSDVFYVKTAVDAHYGKSFTLEHVEWAMRMEGWTDGHDGWIQRWNIQWVQQTQAYT